MFFSGGELMKKPTVIIVGAVILSIIITGVCVMIFHGRGEAKTITDFQSLNLRLSGMRITEEYELIADGDKTEISYYNMSYSNGSEERVLVKQTTCDTQTVVNALNDFGVMKWNGFYGKHPKGVLDGTMFSLTATVNGEKLSANGSQNFPKHFHEFEQWLYNVLKDSPDLTEQTGQ